MILETGMLVFFSLVIFLWQVPRGLRLWLMGHPFWFEVPFSILAYLLHWGTFSGMMAAATAACICHVFVLWHRHFLGYIRAGHFQKGVLQR